MRWCPFQTQREVIKGFLQESSMCVGFGLSYVRYSLLVFSTIPTGITGAWMLENRTPQLVPSEMSWKPLVQDGKAARKMIP